MPRLLGSLVLVSIIAASVLADESGGPAREALQELNGFVGTWKGVGGQDKPRPDPKENWSETLTWGWAFKGKDAWLRLEVKDGKHFKSADLKFDPKKKIYVMEAKTPDGKTIAFTGEYKNDVLTLERVDDKKDTQRLKINVSGEGDKLYYRAERKRAGRTIWDKEFVVNGSREGEKIAQDNKKLCPVTGGLGTIAVTHKGVTYYVCCTGCRDEFNANPEKYVKEFEEKMKKK